MIEQVTGLPYEDYVIDNVLDPLGMADTRSEYAHPMVDHEAIGAHPIAELLTVFVPLMDPPWPSSYIRDHDAGWVLFERFSSKGTRQPV